MRAAAPSIARDDSLALAISPRSPHPAIVLPPTSTGTTRAYPHPGACVCWPGRASRVGRPSLATGGRWHASWKAALAGLESARVAHRLERRGGIDVSAQLEADPVDARVVKALGHPTRVRILRILRDRELASPVELSAELGVTLGTIGYHVRRLESLGFIELAKRTQRRGAIEHHYRARQLLDDAAAAGVAHERDRPTGRCGAEAVAVAQAALAALASGGFDAVLAAADRRVLTLDPHGEAELTRALVRWGRAVERIARASEQRLVRAGEPAAHRCAAVVMCFALPAGVED